MTPEYDGSFEVKWTRFGFHWGATYVERVACPGDGQHDHFSLYVNGLTIVVDPEGKVTEVLSDGWLNWKRPRRWWLYPKLLWRRFVWVPLTERANRD